MSIGEEWINCDIAYNRILLREYFLDNFIYQASGNDKPIVTENTSDRGVGLAAQGHEGTLRVTETLSLDCGGNYMWG